MNGKKASLTFEQIFEWAERVAVKKGWKLNSNEEAVQATIEGLLHNQQIYKRRYCPCRRITRNPEKDIAIICPCVYAAAEIEQDGICLCELFVKR